MFEGVSPLFPYQTRTFVPVAGFPASVDRVGGFLVLR